MEGPILLFLVVVVIVFVVPVVALAKARQALRAIEELKQRLHMLEARLHREDAPAPPPEIVTQPKPAGPIIPSVSVPPPLPVTAVPPPIPETKPIMPVERVQIGAAPPPARTIDWEQFMGAKMFAWIGGFALFLGVAFFVKYSFEHNLIPQELRVAIGFLAGIVPVVLPVSVLWTDPNVCADVAHHGSGLSPRSSIGCARGRDSRNRRRLSHTSSSVDRT